MKTKSKNEMVKLLLMVIFIHLVIIPVALGQTKAEKIDKLMKLYNDYGQFNGSLLVAENGKVILKKGYGLANMEWNIPNQADTKHRLGSITKQFTSMLILQLVQQGKMKLDAPITTYLPDYPKDKGDKITIHHLLTHTSGIPSYTSFPNFFQDYSRNPYSPEKFVTFFSDSTLEFTPGEKFSYCNSGYFLLGLIIEKVTGKTYEQMLQENILGPLKMDNTGFDHHHTILKNRASGYEKYGSSYRNADYLDMSLPYAAGSMYSTVLDLYIWDQALYTDKILPEKYRNLLFTPQISAFGVGYGYGWIIGKMPVGKSTDSVLVYEHGGGINGFNTIIFRIPSEKHLIVLLNNTGGAALNEMSNSIAAILYNKPYDLPKKSLAFSLMDIIQKNGLESGLEWFKKNKDAKDYSMIESEMNTAGYQLLQAGKVKEAIEVFKLNVEKFPESGNVYDSLGEAYLADGNTEMAIKYYKKSVEIDPKNTNAIKILQKLEGK
ncbi:MAG: serine hydrolase [Bacteroidales bacterium]